MAIYSNFDGTMRDAISIGKKGSVIKRVGTDDGISIVKSSAPNAYGTVTLADGTAANHAATKGQLDAKFGTADGQVRTNVDLDARYVLTSDRNKSGGFAGVGTNGKIESSLLPDIRLNKVFVTLNKYGRNAEKNLVVGDSCIITPTALYNPGMVYAKDDVVRVMEYGITKFYAAKRTTTPPTFVASQWATHTLEAGKTYNPGDIVLYDNKLFIVTQTYTVNVVQDPATLQASFSPYSDVTIREWAGGVPYAAKDIVKVTSPGSVKFYSAINAIPAMSSDDWTGTTVVSSTAYKIGDEVLQNNKNYMVRSAYTTPGVVPTLATVTDAGGELIFIEDTAPDAGYYILSKAPADATKGSVDTDWTAASAGTTVDSFNGRVGPVSSQTGDYNSTQISMVNADDMTAGTVDGNLRVLASGRVKKSGDKMTGALTIAKGTATAPSIVLPTSPKSGMFDDNGKVAFTIDGFNKLSISATGVVLGTGLDMATNVISRVGDPQSAGDGANKKYVDSKPLVLSGTASPVADTGKDGDVYMTVLTQGAIKLPFTEQCTDLTTDGITTMIINNSAVPSAALTTNAGITWTTSPMPAASNDTPDTFAYIVSNNSDSFVAIRKITDQSKTTGKINFTSDRGRHWNSSSSSIPSGSYIPAAVYADGSAYMLFPVSNSNTAYSSVDGDVWNEVPLGVSASWACAAGARGCYVALKSDTSAGSKVCAYQDFGNQWKQSTMADSLVWKSVATADGVNFVAVGEKAGGSKATNVLNYSNNRGATWASATLPVSGTWSAVASNGTTFVAICSGSSKAVLSSDSGRTWVEIALPETRGWGRIVGNTRMYMALSTDSSRNDPVAVSIDGGRTWTLENAGQISDINVKNNGKWLTYAGFGGTQTSGQSSSTLYVRRDGDKMTGSLVISHDPSKDSVIASGAILSPALKATKYVSNDSTKKLAGTIFMGAMNPDAVGVGNIYGYATVVEGSSGGFSLITKAQARGANGTTTEVPMMTITKDTFNLAGSVGLGGQDVAYANAALALNISKKKHGISIYSGSDATANINTEIVSIASNNSGLTKHAIKVRANCLALDKDANSPFSQGDYVFGVTTNGVVDIGESLFVGGDRGAAQPVAKVFITGTSDYNTALDINNVTMPKKAGIQLKYSSYANSTNEYKHINIEEAADTSVFLLDDKRFMVNKQVQLNTTTAKNISLYIGGTDALRIPCGTTAQRPGTADEEVGMIRYNSETYKYEARLNGTAGWQEIQVGSKVAGGFVSRDTWKAMTPDAEGHNFKLEILASSHKATSWPFAVFQTSIPGTGKGTTALAEASTSKYRNAVFDYEVDQNFNITVYAYGTSVEDLGALRYTISWI